MPPRALETKQQCEDYLRSHFNDYIEQALSILHFFTPLLGKEIGSKPHCIKGYTRKDGIGFCIVPINDKIDKDKVTTNFVVLKPRASIIDYHCPGQGHNNQFASISFDEFNRNSISKKIELEKLMRNSFITRAKDIGLALDWPGMFFDDKDEKTAEQNRPSTHQDKAEKVQTTKPVFDDNDLKPLPFDFSDLLNAVPQRGGGGESENHRLLKEFVAVHPEAIGLPKGTPKGKPEYPLPSGDSLDVSFQGKDAWVGVEVKSALSDQSDIVRGLFQCVKYQAVMEAFQRASAIPQNSRTILVLEGKLPNRLLPLKNILGIEVVESIYPQ